MEENMLLIKFHRENYVNIDYYNMWMLTFCICIYVKSWIIRLHVCGLIASPCLCLYDYANVPFKYSSQMFFRQAFGCLVVVRIKSVEMMSYHIDIWLTIHLQNIWFSVWLFYTAIFTLLSGLYLHQTSMLCAIIFLAGLRFGFGWMNN